MTIKFYNLKINPQNRFYNKIAYENNINDTNVIETIELNKEIIPNQVFYLKRDNKSDLVKLMGCTYITYEINGTKFGGFITNIQLLAPKGKTIAVYHSVDWWYFTLLNELSFDMHGNCLRAHVNDIEKTNKQPTLCYTTLSPEIGKSLSEYIPYQYSYCSLNGINVNNIKDKQYSFLYVYFNKHDNEDIKPDTGTIGYNQLFLNLTNNTYITSMGYTYVFVLDLIYGYVYPLSSGSSDEPEASFRIRLSNLTNSYITNMCVSDMFCTENYNITIDNFKASITFTNNDYRVYFHKVINDSNLPPYMSFIVDRNNGTSVFNSHITINNIHSSLYNLNSVVKKETEYFDYILSQPKFKSVVYNDIKINNTQIDLLKLYDNNQLKIYLSNDLSTFICKFNGLFNYIITNINTACFKPDTVNDYWTRLNAQITGISGKITEYSGISQQISAIKGGINSVNNMVKSTTESDYVNMATSSMDFSTQLVNYDRGKATERLGEIQQEIADKQYNDGNISTTTTQGFYTQNVSNYGIFVNGYLTGGKIYIATDLHRFGYNTFLQLDEIYKNHQREHFNYFQASDIEITGLPLFIASDLQNMFLSGVHLWTRDIEEFENGTNYQIGLWD